VAKGTISFWLNDSWLLEGLEDEKQTANGK
jgi:hypothetical protein